MSAGSALQELTNTNQSLSIVVNGSILETHTLNFSSQSDISTGSASYGNNRNYNNISLEVKTIQPILMNIELEADDLLF